MATVIGFVKYLNGNFFATNKNGDIIELGINDKITSDMSVHGDNLNGIYAKMVIYVISSGEFIVVKKNGQHNFEFDKLNLEQNTPQNDLIVVLDDESYKTELKTTFEIPSNTIIDVNSDLRKNGFIEENRISQKNLKEYQDVDFVKLDNTKTDVNSILRDADFDIKTDDITTINKKIELVEKVEVDTIIKLFAIDATDGSRVVANEVSEGSSAEYIA
ncbi:MAG: hypothetical protein JXQ66_05520, partial [Campylobacterales bacterium]|nr:hypothetical protein [Campylobacterales bacterium]